MKNLTDDQKALIVSALHAVAPTGGGSKQYHLANQLMAEFGIDEMDYAKVGHLQMVAHDEVREYLYDE